MRCFQRLNCFTTNFCHQKLVKSHVRNERSDQARPGICGGCGGLTSFFFQVRESPSSLLSKAPGTVAKSPTEVCIYLKVSKAKYQVLPYSKKPTKFCTFFCPSLLKWLNKKNALYCVEKPLITNSIHGVLLFFVSTTF